MEALERYAGKNYSLDTALLQTLFKEVKTPSYDEPIEPGSETEVKQEGQRQQIREWDKIKYTENFHLYLKNQERLTSTLIALYNVVLGQCSKKLQDRLKAETNHEVIAKTNDVAALLKNVKIIYHRYEGKVCLGESL